MYSQFTESSSQSGVVNSGPSINLTRTFTAQESQSISLNMSIVDDFVGRENDEQYDIKLISSSLSADITTKGTTSITITDDDGEFNYVFKEFCSILLVIFNRYFS